MNNWTIIKEEDSYTSFVCLDNLIKRGYKNYDLKKCIGKEIGFQIQLKNKEIYEKWIKISSVINGQFLLENNIKIAIRHIKRYNILIFFNEVQSKLQNKEDIIKYIKNEEDKNRYIKSHERIECICPYCGTVKMVKYANLKRYFSCSNCADGISFPEKFMINVLNQLNIKFKTQVSKETFKYIDDKRYDFYLIDYNIIIETHGGQHYKSNKRGRTYEEEHNNDLLKYDIAVLNGFEYNKNYFIIDSRESTLEWMKTNIIKTLGCFFDLNNIDWQQCLRYACSNLQYQVWEYWKTHVKEDNENIIKKEIQKEFPELSYNTILNYLMNGHKCGEIIYESNKLNSLGYYVVDIINKTEHYERTSILMSKYLNIGCGTITHNCQYHKNNNDLKLLHNKYLCFYKNEYTNLNDILQKFNNKYI